MKIAIIGSGVAGLSAARELRQNGVEVKLFDKSRGIGGRMSTRYAGDWEFDHGAQFFTVQHEDFKREIDQAVKAGAAAPWPASALYLDAGEISTDTGRARFVGYPRMNSLPKYWAENLDITLGQRVTKVSQQKSWSLSFEDGSTEGGFHGVLSTIPPAQAKALLPSNSQNFKAVTSAQMHACFCLMIGLPQAIDFGWETLRIKDLPVDWIAVNNAKPGRSKTVGTLVIHSEAQWSDEHAEADRDWVQSAMLNCASALLDLPLVDAPHIALHRWLYASNKISSNVDCLIEDGLVLAGDWCRGGRVQGAWLSGRAAARVFL